jgi:raffinose/stachyose/melibiose transport system substrate-binding protein
MTLAPATVVPADVTLDPAVQEAVGELSKGAGYNPSVYLPAPVKDAWYQAVQGIVTGSATPEAAMAQVQAALAESRAGAGG